MYEINCEEICETDYLTCNL